MNKPSVDLNDQFYGNEKVVSAYWLAQKLAAQNNIAMTYAIWSHERGTLLIHDVNDKWFALEGAQFKETDEPT